MITKHLMRCKQITKPPFRPSFLSSTAELQRSVSVTLVTSKWVFPTQRDSPNLVLHVHRNFYLKSAIAWTEICYHLNIQQRQELAMRYFWFFSTANTDCLNWVTEPIQLHSGRFIILIRDCWGNLFEEVTTLKFTTQTWSMNKTESAHFPVFYRSDKFLFAIDLPMNPTDLWQSIAIVVFITRSPALRSALAGVHRRSHRTQTQFYHELES